MPEDKILDVLIKKVDGLADDVRTNSYRLDKAEAKFDKFQVRIEERFDILGTEINKLSDAVRNLADTVSTMSKQIAAVTSKVIEHEERINSVESRVTVLETH